MCLHHYRVCAPLLTGQAELPGGLKPSAVAGGPSVTKFTHSSCTGMRPSGRPKAAVKKMDATSPTLLLIM